MFILNNSCADEGLKGNAMLSSLLFISLKFLEVFISHSFPCIPEILWFFNFSAKCIPMKRRWFNIFWYYWWLFVQIFKYWQDIKSSVFLILNEIFLWLSVASNNFPNRKTLFDELRNLDKVFSTTVDCWNLNSKYAL